MNSSEHSAQNPAARSLPRRNAFVGRAPGPCGRWDSPRANQPIDAREMRFMWPLGGSWCMAALTNERAEGAASEHSCGTTQAALLLRACSVDGRRDGLVTARVRFTGLPVQRMGTKSSWTQSQRVGVASRESVLHSSCALFRARTELQHRLPAVPHLLPGGRLVWVSRHVCQRSTLVILLRTTHQV